MVAYAVDKSSLCLLSRHMEPVVEGTIGCWVPFGFYFHNITYHLIG
jgi:hypothetical protein